MLSKYNMAETVHPYEKPVFKLIFNNIINAEGLDVFHALSSVQKGFSFNSNHRYK